MKKIILNIVVFILLVGSLSGCTSSEKTIINISILNSKPEIQVQLEEAIKEFSKDNPNIKIKAVKYSQNSTYSNKLQSMYESGNAPTISIVGPSYIDNVSDKLVDLSSEKWAKELTDGIAEVAKNKSGHIIGFPLALEGMGLIYNKKVMDEAGIDISNIKTISSLEEAFKKVEAIGKKSAIITNEAWSLGEHFFSTIYSTQGQTEQECLEFISKVQDGKIDFKSDLKVNGVLDTFDIMKKYNMYSESPLAPSYDKCYEALAKGDVGFWYMGNWASTLLQSINNDNTEFGFIPVPISNNSSDYGNSEIVVGVTQYIVIDKINNSTEQQEAAKEFLNWLVYDEKGKDFIENKAGIIPAINYKDYKTTDSLINDILEYKSENLTMNFMTPYLPTSTLEKIGIQMRRYLNNEINREQLLNSVQEYLKNN